MMNKLNLVKIANYSMEGGSDKPKGFLAWIMKVKELPRYKYSLMAHFENNPPVGDVIEVRYMKGLVVRQHFMQVVDSTYAHCKLVSTNFDPEVIHTEQFKNAKYFITSSRPGVHGNRY